MLLVLGAVFTILFAIVAAMILLPILLIWGSWPQLMGWMLSNVGPHDNLDLYLSRIGVLGDSFGPLNALFTLGSVILILISLAMQMRQNNESERARQEDTAEQARIADAMRDAALFSAVAARLKYIADEHEYFHVRPNHVDEGFWYRIAQESKLVEFLDAKLATHDVDVRLETIKREAKEKADSENA
jgi:hypothetical protein